MMDANIGTAADDPALALNRAESAGLRWTPGVGRAADARAPARASAAALPCLNTINCIGGNKDTLNQLSAGHKKTAFALKINVLWLIERHGLEESVS